MFVNIHFDHSANNEDSLYLDQLSEILQRDYDLPVNRIVKDSVGHVKDAGLTIALSIVTASVSAIGTIVSVLEYLESQKPTYSVSLKSGDKTIVLDQVRPDRLRNSLSELDDLLADKEIVIARR